MTRMLQSLSRVSSIELTYDDFMETYGPIQSDSGSSERTELWENDSFSDSTGSFTAIEESQVECVRCDRLKSSASNESVAEGSNVFPAENCKMNNCVEYTASDAPRRKSTKFHNMASRLARKSFRRVKKKSIDSEILPENKSSLTGTQTKWNLFKRNQDSVDSSEVCVTSYRPLPDGLDDYSMTSATTSLPRGNGSPIARSFSQTAMTSSQGTQVSNTFKRRSYDPSKFDDILPLHVEEKQNFTFEDGLVSPALLPCLSSPKAISPEYNVVKKFDSIREEEETKMVAVVTLLNRRKNSLKIKCQQFDKDLGGSNLDQERSKIIKARLKHMKNKLNVVEQCIQEQAETMKVNSAKRDLQLSLELYKLELQREERTGFPSKHGRGKGNQSRCKSAMASFASCDTLESVEETVFDDDSSVTSSENKESSQTQSNLRYKRHSSAPYGCQDRSKSNLKGILHLDNCTEDCAESGRSRSIDCTVTSDCDSGFDNGEALSRSDVSLNRSLSKSTGSITSTSSRGARSRSNQGSASSTEQNSIKFFSIASNSSSEQSLCGIRSRSSNSSKSSSETLQDEIDPSILAVIDDFEKYAERTRRRLSYNGKLVPLKKGS